MLFRSVTRWGPQAEGFCAPLPHEILMLCETHLTGDGFAPVRARMGAMGWNAFHSNAVYTGRSESGTSAGVAIFSRKSHLVSPLDSCVVAEASAGHDPESLRWVGAVLRLRGVSVLLVELYLVTGIGMSGENIEILQQMLSLRGLMNMPMVVAADWQSTPDELASTGWLDECALVPCVPDTP